MAVTPFFSQCLPCRVGGRQVGIGFFRVSLFLSTSKWGGGGHLKMGMRTISSPPVTSENWEYSQVRGCTFLFFLVWGEAAIRTQPDIRIEQVVRPKQRPNQRLRNAQALCGPSLARLLTEIRRVVLKPACLHSTAFECRRYTPVKAAPYIPSSLS